MENSQVIILSLIGILSLFAFDEVFAESHNIPPISVSTELAIYGNGDNVFVTGNIRDYDSSSGGSLVFFIISPINELVTVGQLVPNSDGSFEFSFIAGGPLWKSNGDYIVETKYGGNTNETIIIYTGGELVITTESEPEPEELKILAQFVDETKNPQSYVDRYNSEPSYKKWFDNNYSEYSSIYEAVGLEEPIMDPESTPVDKEPELSVDKEPEPPVDKEPEPPVDKEPICGTGTIEKNGQCVPDYPDTEPSSKGGGCLIATATYGTELAPQVQQLRELRDNSLLQTESGTSFLNTFNDFYYSFSPIIADYEHENPVFREIVKLAITPMISSLSILNYVDMDSVVEVLGYGISLILLNVGMYFVAPVIVIMKIRR